MARILYQTEYSRASKKTYLKTFEGYDSDSDEEYDVDVSKSFIESTTNGVKTYAAKNGCGRRAFMLKDKKTVTVRIQLFSCFSSFSGK